jgi:hypothetical protein
MLILKHLKTLQHGSIIIQIIIREFVGSLLRSLCGELCWTAVQHNSPHGTSRTYTKRYAAASPHLTFDNKILNSVTLTRNLRTP